MLRWLHRLDCILLLTLISGCAKKTGPSLSPEFAHLPLYTTSQGGARFHDLPLPIQTISHILHEDPCSISLVFTHTMAHNDLLVWYLCTTEQLGWRLLSSAQGPQESLLIFEKPHKLLSVSIRIAGNVVVTLSQKK